MKALVAKITSLPTTLRVPNLPAMLLLRLSLMLLVSIAVGLCAIVVFELPALVILAMLVTQIVIVGLFLCTNRLNVGKNRLEEYRLELLGLLSACETLRLTYEQENATQGLPSLSRGQINVQDKLIREVEFGQELINETQHNASQGQVYEALRLLVAQTRLLAINAKFQTGPAGDRGQGFEFIAARVERLGELVETISASLSNNQSTLVPDAFADVIRQINDLDEKSFDLMSESLNLEQNHQDDMQDDSVPGLSHRHLNQAEVDELKKDVKNGLDQNSHQKTSHDQAQADAARSIQTQLAGIQTRVEKLILLLID